MQLRIVGGHWGGQRIRVPSGSTVRPTPDRVREAIFDVLEHRVVLSDLVVYDLYAGTGALGIEALSRGSPHATFVEAAWRTAAAIRANLERLGVPADRWKVVHARVEPWLKKVRGEPARFLLLLDPPYATAEYGPVLNLVAQSARFAAGTLLVIETSSRAEVLVPPGLELFQTKRYGDTSVSFLLKSAC